MELKKIITRLVIPYYDELTLYTMSFTLLLLITTGIISEWSSVKVSFSPLDFEPFSLFLMLVLFSGLFLSIYHALSKRTKTLLEKKIMLFYTVIINGFTGIWAGYFALENTKGLLIIFPILNIINGFILFSLLRGKGIDERNISDENVSIKEVLIGTLIVTLVFFLCHFVFETNWAITLSICVAYSTNFSSKINGLVVRSSNILKQT
jgi:hypothetical protein